MKRRILIIVLLLLGVFIHHTAQAQDGCNTTITPSTMPLCMMSDYLKNGEGVPVETGLLPNCLRACKGSIVNYIASVESGDSCIWDVYGASSFLITNGGATLQVIWDNGEDGMIWLNTTVLCPQVQRT